jgi:CBS domain-containing protein
MTDMQSAAGASKEADSHPTGGVRTIASFLSRCFAFRAVTADDWERVAAVVTERRVEAGGSVLVEGGPPGTDLLVVHQGAMEIIREGVVLDVLTAGHVFGALTLLTGLTPEFTVKAREASTLYVIPREAAVDLLVSPDGVAFALGVMRNRLVRTARTIRYVTDSHTVPIASLIRRSPVFCGPDTSIREVARLMSEEVVTAVLIKTRAGLGIVTDADLRNKVLAPGATPDAPVSAIMTTPVHTIRDDRLASEASIEMMQAGINHLVVVDARGTVRGVISAGSLMAPDALSPFALRWSIAAARSAEEVVTAAERMPEVFISLVDAHLDAAAISSILSLEVDALTQRLLELAVQRRGPAPVPYAWLALGSCARYEVTLVSDQDNALAFGDTDDPAVDRYFARIAAEVNDGLARCGFAADISGVLARDIHWRMSRSQWVHVFRRCYEVWDWLQTARACVAFDFRRVHGELDVTPLVEVLLEAPQNPSIINRLAGTVVDLRLPLGFRRRLTGIVDIKKGALLPIENIARYYALAHGVTEPGTLSRIRAVGELGTLGDATVAALRDAFKTSLDIRLHHHADALRAGGSPDDTIDPVLLPPVKRVELQEALRLIDEARRHVPRYLT